MRIQSLFQRNKGRRHASSVVFVALAALSVAACGGSSNGSSSGGGTKAQPKVMMLVPLTGANGVYESWKNAFVAQVKAYNSTAKQKVDVEVCDSGSTANQAIGCAQKAANSKSVAVMDFSLAGSEISPILQKAAIPTFSHQGIPVYWTAPNSYALEPAGPVSNFGTIGLAKQQGCSKVYMLYALGGSPADAKSFIDNFTKTTAQYGMKSDSAVIAVGSSNMSSYVAKAAASGADCAFVNAYGTDFIALMKASLTSKMKILTVPGYITPAAIKSLGAAMENVHAVTATWPIADIDQHPGLTEFKEQIDKYSADPKAYDVNAMQTWSASRAITIAISQVQGDVTAASVSAQLDKFHDFDPLVGPKVSFDRPSSDKPEYARIFAPYALQINWKNGVEHANGSFFNFFTTEPVT